MFFNSSESGSAAFEEFLDFIGERVELKGFSKYRAGLDMKSENMLFTVNASCIVDTHCLDTDG